MEGVLFLLHSVSVTASLASLSFRGRVKTKKTHTDIMKVDVVGALKHARTLKT